MPSRLHNHAEAKPAFSCRRFAKLFLHGWIHVKPGTPLIRIAGFCGLSGEALKPRGTNSLHGVLGRARIGHYSPQDKTRQP